MTSARRIAIGMFGSAGDVFPLVPLVQHLRADGHEVLIVASRSVGLYLRTIGMPAVGFGDGSELAATQDAALFTIRFGGWSSYRRIFTKYVVPSLGSSTERITGVLRDWKPDIVATTNYAVAPRLAAFRLGLPHVGMSIYPQMYLLNGDDHCFAKPFTDEVRRIVATGQLERHGLAEIGFGVDDAGVLLGDPALVPRCMLPPTVSVTGMPAWDLLPGRGGDDERATLWLGESEHERLSSIVVTLGSFVGAAPSPIWRALAAAVERLGVRALVVNARTGDAFSTLERSGRACCVGYVPFSLLFDHAAAVLHHGGIGTTYAALRARRPSVVVPQAFDQPFVGSLVEGNGVGVALRRSAPSAEELRTALESVIASPAMYANCRDLGERLVPAPDAARRAASALLERVPH